LIAEDATYQTSGHSSCDAMRSVFRFRP
jgi:hypothetical protein